MKKTYIQPQLTVFHTVVTSMIAESNLGLNGDAGNKLDAGDILSKGSGDWDIWGTDSDDDDYDY